MSSMRLIRRLHCSTTFLNSYALVIFNKFRLDRKDCFFKPIPFSVFQRQGSILASAEMRENGDSGLFSPNPKVSGMTNLDREAFTKTIQVPVLKVKKEILNKVMKTLKHRLIHRPQLKRIIDDPNDDNNKYVILDPDLVTSENAFDARDHEVFKQFEINPQVVQHDLQLTYESFKTEEILQAVLPKGQDVTSSFSRVGHIAHMNLRDHQLPYKNLIGQVILDKNPGLTSVVNKINVIDSTYRNFQMEVLAGEENMMTKMKENGITYEFDFSKVYWNSRLSTEHDRITGLLKSGDVIFDVFAGVGPFAIPAAKKNCVVFANDLNPESYKWLLHNCKLNKVDKKVQAFNLDGREFIRTIVKKELSQYIKSSSPDWKNSLHIVMNLPALAMEFIDAFRHLLEEEPCSKTVLPTLHVYSFSKDESPEKDVKDRAQVILGTVLERCSVHLVRKVAPNKDMMCLSFELPVEVLFANHSTNTGEPVAKRFRRDGEENEANV